jgi:hypothetical protein
LQRRANTSHRRRSQTSCGPSAERHLRAIRKFTEAGFDHIVLVQIGPDQDYFFDLFKYELAAALRG